MVLSLDQDFSEVLEQLRECESYRAQFFESHRDELLRLATALLDPRLRRRIDEIDVVQEVFLRYATEIDDYLANPRLPPRIWLRRMMRQTIWQIHRSHLNTKCRDIRRENNCWVNSDVLVGDLVDSLSSVGSRLNRMDMNQKVREIVAMMPATEREIVWLVHMESMSIREVALELGLAYEKVKKRYSRSLTRLRRLHSETLTKYLP